MPLPRVLPIAPIARKEPFDDPAFQFELKYDGFRALCYLEAGRNRFLSRNGNILTRFDELADQVASEIVDFDEAILDGEVIAPDETGRPKFYDLLRSARSPAYIAFDLLWLSGTDLRSWPLRHRQQALEGILQEGSRVISPPLSVHARGCQLFELILEHDLEGIPPVAKSAWPIRMTSLPIGSRSKTGPIPNRWDGLISSTPGNIRNRFQERSRDVNAGQGV